MSRYKEVEAQLYMPQITGTDKNHADYWFFSWSVEVENKGREPLNIGTLTVKFVDRKGLVLYEQLIRGFEAIPKSKKFNGITMIQRPLADKVKKAEAQLQVLLSSGDSESMNKLVNEVVNDAQYRYYPLGEYVVRAIGVCGGRPTFKYTEIEVAGTLDRLAAGAQLYELIAEYEGKVSSEAVMEALRMVTAGFLQTLPELEPA